MRTRHSYYYSYYYVFTYTPIDHSKHGIHYLRRPPFLPYGVQLQYTAPTRHTARQSNEPYTPRELYDEPLIPHST